MKGVFKNQHKNLKLEEEEIKKEDYVSDDKYELLVKKMIEKMTLKLTVALVDHSPTKFHHFEFVHFQFLPARYPYHCHRLDLTD